MSDLAKKPDYRFFCKRHQACGVNISHTKRSKLIDISEQIYFIKVHEPIIQSQNEVTLQRLGANLFEPSQLCTV